MVSAFNNLTQDLDLGFEFGIESEDLIRELIQILSRDMQSGSRFRNASQDRESENE